MSARRVGASARSAPPWLVLLERSLERNKDDRSARYFQLATVRADGTPANRTVVFRGFHAPASGSGRRTDLKFVTDARSSKVADVEHCSWCEACWYFGETREQYRITGALRLVRAGVIAGAGNDNDDDDDEEEEEEGQRRSAAALAQARVQQWRALSDAARAQFYWPSPRSPQSSDDRERVREVSAAADSAPVPDAFCLALLTPHTVDHVQLASAPQRRTLYARVRAGEDSARGDAACCEWRVQEVNP